MAHFFFPERLKKLKLLSSFRYGNSASPLKNLHHPKLLVCNVHDAYMPFWREYIFDTPYMHLRIFFAAAMAQINAELKHLKPVC